MKIHILTINFNQSEYTKKCIESINESTFKNFTIYLLDNGSKDPFTQPSPETSNLKFYHSEENLGFAEGNNLLLRKALPKTKPEDLILFLNNDTEIDPNLLQTLSTQTNDVIATRMMKLDNPQEIDNLGLTMRKSGLAVNRKSPDKKLFGPSGGCAAYTARALNTIQEKTGHIYDKDYFCYAEDADLAWRAQNLGLKPIYLDNAICYHKIGAASGGEFSKFTMYHTLRNTLYNIVKDAKASTLIKHSPWIIGFQLELFFRYLPTKRFTTLLKVHKDFLKALPKLLNKRRR